MVMEVLSEAAAWLQEKGIDQWPSPPNEHWQRRMAAAIGRGEVHLVSVDRKPVGIVRLTWSDPYWPDDGLAVYVHSMAIRREMHGRRIGEAILAWAEAKAGEEGRQLLRLDCLAGNQRLRRYYREQGFGYRGEHTDRDYSAALFEKEVGVAAQR